MGKTKRKTKRKMKSKSSQGNLKLLGLALIAMAIAVGYSAFYIVTGDGNDSGISKSVFKQGATTLLNHCAGVCNQVASGDGDMVIHYNGDIIVSGAGEWDGNYFPKEKSKSVNIPAGNYTVHLESYDDFVGREDEAPSTQSREQYYVVFKDGNTEIARTGTTNDLEDGVERAGNITFTNSGSNVISLSRAVDEITVVHAGPSSELLKHGFEPVCMLLEREVESECGDGNVDDGEECDAGDNNGEVCSASYGATCTYCDNNCNEQTVMGGNCGDGTRDPGEGCDDGNTVNGDGCSASCTIEASCGNGTRDPGEGCDDGNNVNGDGCSAGCSVEVTSSCGDGTRDSGEECDDGNTTNGDGCSSRCREEEEEEDDDDDDCNSSIGNYIWYDTNGNGVQEDIEEGIEGIKVCAFNGNDKECDTTNSSGRYKIDDLCEHTYDVVVKDVGGMVQTYDPDGKKDNKTEVDLDDNDDHTKADFGYRGAAPATGLTTNIALLIGISTLITIGILMVMKKKGAL